MKRSLWLGGLAAAVCLTVSCATGPAAGSGSLSDADIRANLLTRLQSDPVTAGSPIGVRVNEGLVTLSGTTRDPSLRMRAKAIAQDTPGVRGVIDDTYGGRVRSGGSGE